VKSYAVGFPRGAPIVRQLTSPDILQAWSLRGHRVGCGACGVVKEIAAEVSALARAAHLRSWVQQLDALVDNQQRGGAVMMWRRSAASPGPSAARGARLGGVHAQGVTERAQRTARDWMQWARSGTGSTSTRRGLTRLNE